MTPISYYNEFDPYAAAWLRNLINAGLIAPGIVDERSIEDVRPDDLDGFTQCHFFAGIGVWSLALRNAGWSDNRRVWTASCPCQPYSQAGEGAGFADERHLWPHFHHLLREQKRPVPVVLGEQVASKFAEPWVDLVHADMEGLGYAFGCVPFPAAGVGAPHIRDRNYWAGVLADTDHEGSQGRLLLPERGDQRLVGARGLAGGVAVGVGQPCGQRGSIIGRDDTGSDAQSWSGSGCSGELGGMADAYGRDASAERQQCSGEQRQQPQDCGTLWLADANHNGQRQGASTELYNPEHHPESCGDSGDRSGPTNGFWRDADWLGCTDGKWRPVEPGTSPLAAGAAGGVGRTRADKERLAALLPRKDQGSRQGRLRAYGNAINAEAARVFIQTVMAVID